MADGWHWWGPKGDPKGTFLNATKIRHKPFGLNAL
jgi:hypothetical protein